MQIPLSNAGRRRARPSGPITSYFSASCVSCWACRRPTPKRPIPATTFTFSRKRSRCPTAAPALLICNKWGCFVLEAKQGSDRPDEDQAPFSAAELRARQRRKRGTAVRGTAAWDTAMEKARQQAQLLETD
jgi:hypothetical protein